MELAKHSGLKLFHQFGFIYKKDAGTNQVRGTCPFCESQSKSGVKPTFFINPEDRTWDCKICGLSGGYKAFLQEVYESSQTAITPKQLIILATKKGLKTRTLKKFHVGYFKNKYILPVWGHDKKELISLKLYNITTNLLKISAGCTASLYNVWSLQNSKTIKFVEGEWDVMAMDEVITTNELEDTVPIGTPGANTFKPEWVPFFKGRIVHNFYDNDKESVKNNRLIIGAGKAGQRKVQNMLSGVTKELLFVNWPKSYEHRFDFRDLYLLKNKNAVKTLKIANSLLKKDPMPIIAPEGFEGQAEEQEAKEKPFVFTGTGLSLKDVYAGYQKYLYLQDLECLDMMFGSLIANRFKGDPVWMFLVASSGGTKSELIMSLDDAPLIHSLSSLTPHTLVSGTVKAGGADPSLIPRLNGKVLCMKDFTVILEMLPQSREAIITQLRDSYDGKTAFAYGSGLERHYESKFGMLAGVTPAIDMHLEGQSAMGERFLSFYLHEDNSFGGNSLIMCKAIDNLLGGHKEDMRGYLQDIASQALNCDFAGSASPTLPDEVREQLYALAQFTAIARGTVPRDKYTKEILRKPLIEKPTRLVTQFVKLGMGIAAFKQQPDIRTEDITLVARSALSSIPYHLNYILNFMVDKNINGNYMLEDVSKALRLPTQATKRYMEDMFHLRLLSTGKVTPTSEVYHIPKEIKHLIKLGKIYSPKALRQIQSNELMKQQYKKVQKSNVLANALKNRKRKRLKETEK